MKFYATVYVVDDDLAMRDWLALLLSQHGLSSRLFASAESLLSAYSTTWFGCILADVQMPGMSGLELQTELTMRACDIPVVIMSGNSNLNAARTALQAGAADFLTKPIDDVVLIDVLQAAIKSHATARRAAWAGRGSVLLTPREQDVADLVAGGMPMKRIAEKLGISPRTVEVYKVRLSQKIRARQADS